MKVLGSIAIYHKLVFEVKYEQGFTYLDRCGTTANQITENNPDWVIHSDSINPQNAPLTHVPTGIHFNFGPFKYDFSLDQPIGQEAVISTEDIQTFVNEVQTVSQIVHDELQLKQFRREGFRIWYIFETGSEEKSCEWISKLGAFSVSADLTRVFEGKLASLNYVVVVEAEERKYRISVTPVERLEQLNIGTPALRQLPRELPKHQREHLLKQLNAKKRLLANPQFAVMIDVDAFIEDPIEIAPADFIEESLRKIEKRLPKAVGG